MTLSPSKDRSHEHLFQRALPFEEALGLVLSHFTRLTPELVTARNASNRVIAEPVIALEDVPSFTNSAMDGFALRARDTAAPPVRLEIVETIMAGAMPKAGLREGQAARIMTGAPLPPEADAVCPFEQAGEYGLDTLVLDRPIDIGANVRRPGEDVGAGATVFEVGEVLGPAATGVLASLGIAHVTIYPSPVVGVISTGDELVEGPSPRPPGKIRDANRPAILETLRQAGFVTRDLGIGSDDICALTDRLSSAAGACDAIVVSAGVSAGDRDIVGGAIERLCDGASAELAVALRPGKPLAVGHLPTGQTIVGLPGNPVAAMVGLELFVLPGLRKMAGRSVLSSPLFAAISNVQISRRRDGKLHVLPARVALSEEGQLRILTIGERGSHQLRALALANALALVPDGEGCSVGDQVRVLLRGDVAALQSDL